MLNVIECSGHPRDMGLEQGRCCRAAVSEVVREHGLPDNRSRRPILRSFTSGPTLGTGPGREVVRHFTHLSERIDGLAREARVPTSSLMDLHVRTSAGSRGGELLAGEAIGAITTRESGREAPALLVRSLGAVGDSNAGWLVRRSRPEVGFASLEVTLPWLASAVAGINDVGLCATFVPNPSAGEPDAAAVSAAPAILLVQECLQRFRDLDASLDWCTGRPVSGQGALMIVDAGGGAAIVRVSGIETTIERASDELLAAGGPPPLEALLRGEAREKPALQAERLARICVDGDGRVGSWLRLDPSKRLLELKSASDGEAHLQLEV